MRAQVTLTRCALAICIAAGSFSSGARSTFADEPLPDDHDKSITWSLKDLLSPFSWKWVLEIFLTPNTTVSNERERQEYEADQKLQAENLARRLAAQNAAAAAAAEAARRKAAEDQELKNSNRITPIDGPRGSGPRDTRPDKPPPEKPDKPPPEKPDKPPPEKPPRTIMGPNRMM